MIRKILIFLFLVSQGSPELLADNDVDPKDAKLIFAANDVKNQLLTFTRLTDKQLLSRSTELINNQSKPVIVRERLLFEISLLLRSKPESTENQQINNLLASYESKAKWIQKDVTYHQHVIAYPVAASARANMLHWQILKIINNLTMDLNTTTDEVVDYLTGTYSVEKQMVLRGLFNQINYESIMDIGDQILHDNANIPSPLLLPIARTLKNTDLYLLAINNYRYDRTFQVIILSELSKVNEYLNSDDTQRVLLNMLSINRLKSLAIQQMSNFIVEGSIISETLFKLLADPESGGDAAMALSKSNDLMTLQMLQSNLQSSNPIVIKRSLLALQLNASFNAKQMLSQYVKTTNNKQLKQEVEKWLNAS